MRKKKGIPAGFRKHRGSFLRSFLSDAMDTAQEAFDEFMERDFVTPKEQQEARTKEQPKDTERKQEPDPQHTQQARDDDVAEQIKSLTQTVAALAQAVATMKETQNQEWQEMAKKKRGAAQ